MPDITIQVTDGEYRILEDAAKGNKITVPEVAKVFVKSGLSGYVFALGHYGGVNADDQKEGK